MARRKTAKERNSAAGEGSLQADRAKDFEGRSWKDVKIIRAFHAGEDKLDIGYELGAERSDGVLFKWQFIALKDATPKECVEQFIHGLLNMSTYLNCDCIAEYPCKEHEWIKNPYQKAKPPQPKIVM